LTILTLTIVTTQKKHFFRKKVGEKFVNRNQIFVPLHRRNERGLGRPLKEKFARIKFEKLRARIVAKILDSGSPNPQS